MTDPLPAAPLDLRGDPYTRGRAQAALRPDLAEHVRHAVAHRLAETAGPLADPTIRGFIAAQRDATARLYPAILAEIDGIADGFAIDRTLLFDYLHCSTAADLAAMPEHDPDGCSAFAVSTPSGALVAKNRDYRAEHIPIQQVMRHTDPDWGGRSLLVIGSLGSPGNFSSGMNSAGLALADTASRTTDLGPGLHRYFLMTWLLAHCTNVADAVAAIRAIPHTGSGLLLLGDASGAVAAIELGHRRVGIEHLAQGRARRTNHFILPDMAHANMKLPASRGQRANSAARLRTLSALVAAMRAEPTAADARALLSSHGTDAGAALCRHGGDDLSATIAGAVWNPAAGLLDHAAGPPCSTPWQRFSLAA